MRRAVCGWGAVACALAVAHCSQPGSGTDAGDGADVVVPLDASIDVVTEHASPPCTFPEGGAPGTVDYEWVYVSVSKSFNPLAMVTDAQGNIYISGADTSGVGACWSVQAVNSTIDVVKLVAATGSVDTTFGANGHMCISAPNESQSLTALVFDPSNNTLVGVGSQGTSTANGVLIVRFDTNGNLVTTFGTNGMLTISHSGKLLGPAFDVALDATFSPPKVVVAGSNAWLDRLEANGAQDTSFNLGQPLMDGCAKCSYEGLGVTPDGYYISGISSPGTGMLLRMTRTGTVDPAFNGGAPVFVELISSYVDITSVVPLSSSRLALGAVVDPTANANVVAYTNTGAQDLSFGTVRPQLEGGALTRPGSPLSTQHLLMRDCEGRLVVTGTITGTGMGGVVRVFDDGGADKAFGTGGVATLQYGASSDAVLSTEDPITGRIIVALRDPTTKGLAIVRLFR